MHIKHNSHIFWKDETSLLIGFDQRACVVIDNINSHQQDFISFLRTPRQEEEIARIGQQCQLSHEEIKKTISLLEEKNIVEHDDKLFTSAYVSSEPIIDNITIHIDTLDPLGVAIGSGLVRAGFTRITFNDNSPISYHDTQLLQHSHIDSARSHGFLSLLRSISTKIVTTGIPHFAVVTGSYLISPLQTASYMDNHIPHLLAWGEDIDIHVGPIVVPYQSACAYCLYMNNMNTYPSWPVIAPQALRTKGHHIPQGNLDLVASYAVRSIISFFSDHHSLRNSLWKIPPLPHWPRLITTHPHHECGCTSISSSSYNTTSIDNASTAT
ncbi:MAG: hypothetical protein J6M18_01455 [Actinomycetaceae bacterium]|nr:hypothetical protein [Actinomycetaceae bacterium]